MKKFFKKLAILATACISWVSSSGFAPANSFERGESLMWQESYVQVVGGSVKVVAGGYSESGNTLQIKPTASQTDVYLNLPVFEEYGVGEKVHISFRIRSVELADKKYDTYKVCTWGGIVVDYAFENGKWNWVNFDGTILQKDGVKTVLLSLTELNPELYTTIYISEFKIDDEIFDTEDLFGGVEMIFFEGVSDDRMLGCIFVSGDEVVVFDGGMHGDGAELAKIIYQYGRKVSGWFISHFHHDHCTALREILENEDIEIETLYYDFPTVDAMPAAKDYIETFNEAVERNRHKINNIVQPKEKDLFSFNDIVVKVLNTMAPTSDANNTSIVYKVETPIESVLLWGDTNMDKFIKNPYSLSELKRCRVVVMAHHGQGGVSKNVYDAIDDIKICLYAGPRWLYDNDRGEGIGSSIYGTLETRSWMREKGVRISLSQADGRIHFK